jgi:MFS superfamily sulfate permease-like transporter
MKFFDDIKPDFSAGFSVALVALPLSIGIALASGAPASAGLIAAIIGGLIGSWMGGSYVTINGPAAGLIVIVLDAILELGKGDNVQGFKLMLGAAVVGGALQVVFGALKFGRKGLAFPASVIHGMMAAIGLIIIAKQMHILIGHTPVAKNPVLLFAEVPRAIFNMEINPLIATIGIISLVFLVVWSKLKTAWAKKVPAPLIATILGSILALSLGVHGKGLLTIPSDFSNWIIFPDFSAMSTFAGWKAAITLALVASLETVLSAAAVDKMDPQRRESNLDRDLLSKGVCNMLSASIGGLPMIAEIVRSSANVSYGAKTYKANLIHGSVILALVLLLPNALSMIPLAALAAILLMVGSRLGNPSHFIHAKKIGWDNLVGFAVTLILTLAEDLLVGIIVGALCQFLVEIYHGLKLRHLFKPEFKTTDNGKDVVVAVESALAFSNYLTIKDLLADFANKGKNVQLELSHSGYIDPTVMDALEDLKKYFQFRKLTLHVGLSEKHFALGVEHNSARKLSA